jgi:hypothetical protein
MGPTFVPSGIVKTAMPSSCRGEEGRAVSPCMKGLPGTARWVGGVTCVFVCGGWGGEERGEVGRAGAGGWLGSIGSLQCEEMHCRRMN